MLRDGEASDERMVHLFGTNLFVFIIFEVLNEVERIVTALEVSGDEAECSDARFDPEILH